MKHLFSIILLTTITVACSSEENSPEQTPWSNINDKLVDALPDEPICPEGNHQDSLIPIIWGLPTEETFQKEDSGLVWLGGCEMPSDNPPEWHCKIHNVQF